MDEYKEPNIKTAIHYADKCDNLLAEKKAIEELYSAATKALNSQIEINTQLQAELKGANAEIEKLKTILAQK